MFSKISCSLVTFFIFSSVTFAAAPVAQIKLGVKKGEMKFEPENLSVKAGQKVVITFTNIGDKKAGGLPHNFVLVKPGAQEKVGMASMAASSSGYIPDAKIESQKEAAALVIAASQGLLQPGEVQKIEFTAPSTAGSYPYICTFPGHFMMMKGNLTVK